MPPRAVQAAAVSPTVPGREWSPSPTLRPRRGAGALWRLPLVEDYRSSLDSDVADLRNISDPAAGVSAGAITAALFLQAFAGGTRWAHLDVAGAARAAKDVDEVTKGGSGYGVRLLLAWLATLPS